MSERWVEFGDRPPVPSGDLRQHDSRHWRGRLAYGLRAMLLRTSHPQPRPPLIPKPDQVKKLLVVQLEGLGDLVLIEPALRALRMHYPHAERLLVAPPFGVELFAGSGWGVVSSADRLDQLIDESHPFDVAIDLTLRVELRTARQIGNSNIPLRIGYNRGGRGVYYNIPLPMPESTVPTRQLHTQLISNLGAIALDDIPRLPRGEDRLRRGRDLWKSVKLTSPIVLMPGAALAEQRWALENFVQVGRALKRQKMDVAVMTGPGEEAMGKELSTALGVPWWDAVPMLDLMDLLASSRVVMCNNTGPLHLAGALNVPTVSTMGQTNPWRWWPVSDAPAIVFRGGSQGAVGDLTRIDPLEVTAALLHLIEKEG